MIINTSNAGFVSAANPQDYDSIVQATTWNGLHQMTSMNANLPASVAKIVFLKGGMNFVNTFMLDWTGGTTSTSDIELTLRDNSATSGMFQNAGQGTVPVFSFPANSYGGTAKNFVVTLLRTGRFAVGMRIIDSGGNYSIFEMDWIVM